MFAFLLETDRTEGNRAEIRYSAQLHDVGKMSVDVAVLRKRGPLNADEKAMFDKSVDAVKGLVTACKGIDGNLG